MFNMTEAHRWACLLWAAFLLMSAHVQPGTGLSTATESYEELLQAVKSGTFSLDGKSKDDSKAVLQQILDKSKYYKMQFWCSEFSINGTTHND